MNNIQQHYEGFLYTPTLWNSGTMYGLTQFKTDSIVHSFNQEINNKLRLGKYVERLVTHQLSNHNNIQILAKNIQIQQGTRTLGELDCILLQNSHPIHLEIVYKFYVYDPSLNHHELACWIGPNRKDSLIEKLEKLTQKQLPLLYSKECQNALKSLSIDTENMKQQVYFKAQLFIPLHTHKLTVDHINPDCIVGFYIHKKELPQFKDAKFYIPSKKDWLCIPHEKVDWLSFDVFLEKSAPYLERHFSPMCWLKTKNGILQKFFLVWWTIESSEV
jgi:hypothetical protein